MPSLSNRDRGRHAPLAMDATQFRALGHSLVDQIASLLESVPRRPQTRDESPSDVRAALGLNGGLPAEGTGAATLLTTTAAQLFEHSLCHGHPRFFGSGVSMLTRPRATCRSW